MSSTAFEISKSQANQMIPRMAYWYKVYIALNLTTNNLPTAVLTNLILLIFLTSDLVPHGSPGLCTETLASTLIEPSVKINKYIGGISTM